MKNETAESLVHTRRFDAYEVSPVIENTASDGDKYYQAFYTMAEAQKHVESNDDVENQRIRWTLYGRWDGSSVDAIADRDTEAEVFDLLYSITGIRGMSGQRIYPVPYSTTVWTVTSDTDNGMETRIHASAKEAYWDFLQRWESCDENAPARELFNAGNYEALNDYLQDNIGKGSNDSFSVEAHTLHF